MIAPVLMESLLIQLTILAKNTTFVTMEVRLRKTVDLELFLTQISKSVIMKSIPVYAMGSTFFLNLNLVSMDSNHVKILVVFKNKFCSSLDFHGRCMLYTSCINFDTIQHNFCPSFGYAMEKRRNLVVIENQLHC